MTGDVERHGVGEPVAPQLAYLDTVDLDRLEQSWSIGSAVRDRVGVTR